MTLLNAYLKRLNQKQKDFLLKFFIVWTFLFYIIFLVMVGLSQSGHHSTTLFAVQQNANVQLAKDQPQLYVTGTANKDTTNLKSTYAPMVVLENEIKNFDTYHSFVLLPVHSQDNVLYLINQNLLLNVESKLWQPPKE